MLYCKHAPRPPPSFFNRPTVEVARDLIGKTLVRRFPDGTQTVLRITETEAYDGLLFYESRMKNH